MIGCVHSFRAEHPRLFFRADDLPGIRRRARTSNGRLVAAARTMLDWDIQAGPAGPRVDVAEHGQCGAAARMIAPGRDERVSFGGTRRVK